MGETKKFIFIDTSRMIDWPIGDVKKNLQNFVSKGYVIVIPDVQIHELEHVFNKVQPYSPNSRDIDNSIKYAEKMGSYAPKIIEEFKKIKENTIKIEQDFEVLKKKALDDILQYLGQQTIITAEPKHYFGALNRVSSIRAPYTDKPKKSPEHKHYDSLFWEILLHNNILPKKSNLYIHSKDGDFSSEESFMALKHEWAILNKGNLERYVEDSQLESPEASSNTLKSLDPNSEDSLTSFKEPTHIVIQRKLASALDRVEMHLDNGRISIARDIFHQAQGIFYNAQGILLYDTLRYYEKRIERIVNRLTSNLEDPYNPQF